MQNLRTNAKLNFCVFRCQVGELLQHPMLLSINAPSQPRELPFEVKLLERHLYSTQSFIPMTCSKVLLTGASHTELTYQQRYLVVVAHNNSKTNKPDLSTLRVFVAAANQGITYYPGIWHHPMIALDSVTGTSQGLFLMLTSIFRFLLSCL